MVERGNDGVKEERLIKLAKQGDLDAYDSLMSVYYPVVESFSFQMGHSFAQVDDLTQEVFLRVYRHLDQYTKGKFTTWLYKITLNVTRDVYRKQKSYQAKENRLKQDGSVSDDQQTVEEQVLHEEQDRVLHERLQQLDDKYKLPIILYYFQEKEQRDIADILEVPLNTVKTRLSRGKEQLRASLLEEDI